MHLLLLPLFSGDDEKVKKILDDFAMISSRTAGFSGKCEGWSFKAIYRDWVVTEPIKSLAKDMLLGRFGPMMSYLHRLLIETSPLKSPEKSDIENPKVLKIWMGLGKEIIQLVYLIQKVRLRPHTPYFNTILFKQLKEQDILEIKKLLQSWWKITLSDFLRIDDFKEVR